MSRSPDPSRHAAAPAESLGSRQRRAASIGLLLLAAGAWALAGCSESRAGADNVSLEMARAEYEAGRAILIDIREPEEHATGVAPGAQLLPMRQLRQRLAEVPTRADQPVLLICNTQNRSSATVRALRELGGYGHVRFVDGGMSEWARRGWPMVKPGAPAAR